MLGQVSLIRSTLLLGSLLLGAGASAEIYKSVDQDGNVVFSQKAPVGVHSETVKPRFTKRPANKQPAVSDAVADGADSATKAPDTVAEPGTPAATPAAPTELTPEQKVIKAENCANARSQLKQLSSPRANRLQYVNEKKELVFYSEDDRAVRIKETEKAAKQYCE